MRFHRILTSRLATAWLVVGLCALRCAVAGAPAAADAGEPSAASCAAAIQAARTLVEALPSEDLSRRVAESHLVQAGVEGGNGEFDDCLEFAERATVEVREHRHRLQPGEKLEAHPLP